MNLKYPIFLKISYFADGEFWKRLFENMAYNKPPLCVYLRLNPDVKSELSIIYHHKKRGFIYYIHDQYPKQMYEDIRSLLINNVKIQSVKDKLNDSSSLVFSSWNNLKKTFIKNHLVIKYVIEKLKPKSINETRILINKINLGLSFKTINTKNITMRDNCIEHIDLIDLT